MSNRRTRLLTVTVVGMLACWLYAWAQMLQAAASAAVPVASSVVLLLVLAAVWQTVLGRTRLRRVPRLAAYWALWPLAASLIARLLLYSGSSWLSTQWLLALPQSPVSIFFEPKASEIILFLGSAAAWYLGQRPVVHSPNYGGLLADFQFGLVMLLVAFLVGYGFDVAMGRPLLLTLAFFGLSITAIASARSTDTHGSASGLSRGQLSGAILMAIGAVGFTALLMAIIVRPDVIDAVINGVRYAGSLIGRAIAYLASLIPTPDYSEVEPPGAPATGDDSALIEWYRSLPVPAIIRRVVYVLWVTVVLGVLLFALWRMCAQVLEWLRRRRHPVEGAVIESSGSFWADLYALGARIAALIRRVARRLRAAFAAGVDTSGRTGVDIYLHMIRWASRKVLPRRPWQSPYEYLESLRPLLPAAAQDLAFVTNSYVHERYGGRRVPEDVRADMEAAVQRIKRAGHKRSEEPKEER